MKSLTVLLFLLTSSLSFAQGLIFSTVTEKPKVLMLEKKISPLSGDSYFVHVEENPLTHVNVLFMGDQLLKLQNHLLKSESSRIFCDGDLSLENDSRGIQFIALSTVSVCIDEDGWIIAHSFGKQLAPDEIQRKAGELSKSIKKKEIGAGIYQGSGQKNVNNNSSSGQQRSNGGSRQ